jgi:hypothetical protein
MYSCISESLLLFKEGQTYNVMFDGTEYECVVWKSSEAIMIGSGMIMIE